MTDYLRVHTKCGLRNQIKACVTVAAGVLSDFKSKIPYELPVQPTPTMIKSVLFKQKKINIKGLSNKLAVLIYNDKNHSEGDNKYVARH